MQTPSLTAERLRVLYGNYHALKDVSFGLAEGQYSLLIGTNGAGKSTLLRCLAGWQRPSGGVVSVFGTTLDRDERRARQWIKLVPDTPQFYPELTAWEHVGWVAAAHRVAAWQAPAEALMEAFGVASNKNAYPSNFSRGMQYKLALTMSIVSLPRVLLLDEPFGPLDPYAQEYLARYLRQLANAGVAVFASTHVLPDSGPPDRVIVLDQGEVLDDVSWERVKERYSDAPPSAALVHVLRDALQVRRNRDA